MSRVTETGELRFICFIDRRAQNGNFTHEAKLDVFFFFFFEDVTQLAPY